VRVFAISPYSYDGGAKSAASNLLLSLMCRVCDGCYENWKEMERLCTMKNGDKNGGGPDVEHSSS